MNTTGNNSVSPVRAIDLSVSLHPEAGAVDGRSDLSLDGTPGTLDMVLPDQIKIGAVQDEQGKAVAYQRTDQGHLLIPTSGAHRLSIQWAEQLSDPRSWLAYASPASSILCGLAGWYAGAQYAGVPVKLAVTAPSDQIVQVSARPDGVIRNADGTITTLWSATQGEPGISLAAGHYLERELPVPGSETRVRTLALPEHAAEADPMEAELVSIVDFYEHLLGPVPDGNVTAVDVPQFPGTNAKGMAGLIAMGSASFTHPPRKAWPNGVDVQNLAHETAHTWFGGLVSAGAHPFFSESMAQYLSDRYLEAKYPDLARLDLHWDDQLYRQSVQAHGDHCLATARYGDPDYFATLYYKGPLFLHMLEKEVGQGAMDQALRGLLHDFPFQVPDGDRFEQLVVQASGKDVHALFEQYFRGNGTLPQPAD